MEFDYPKVLCLHKEFEMLEVFQRPNLVLRLTLHVIIFELVQDRKNRQQSVTILTIRQSLQDLCRVTFDEDYFRTFDHSAPLGAELRVCKGF